MSIINPYYILRSAARAINTKKTLANFAKEVLNKV